MVEKGGLPRTVLTGASPLENSSEYDFNGNGSSSAKAGATNAPLPAPLPAIGGENAASPTEAAEVRNDASVNVAIDRFAADTKVAAAKSVVVMVGVAPPSS